jgi:hypothetical protein
VEEFNPRQLALYLGLQLEELAEKLEVLKFTHIITSLRIFSNDLKSGIWDYRFEDMSLKERAEILDADIDLAWVSLGAASSLNVDVASAIEEVSDSNMSKTVACPACFGIGFDCISCDGEGRVMEKDKNGKVKKGPHYFPPMLEGVFRGATKG